MDIKKVGSFVTLPIKDSVLITPFFTVMVIT